jgi:hypothetical protein
MHSDLAPNICAWCKCPMYPALVPDICAWDKYRTYPILVPGETAQFIQLYSPIYVTSLHLVEPLLSSSVEFWQRTCHIFLSCVRDRSCLQSTPFSSNAFWMLSCHFVRGLPLVLLPSYRASHAMRGYLDSGILAT